jgi:hypothetical protein
MEKSSKKLYFQQYISYFMTIVFIEKWNNRPVSSHWQTNENWKRNFNTIDNDIIVIHLYKM